MRLFRYCRSVPNAQPAPGVSSGQRVASRRRLRSVSTVSSTDMVNGLGTGPPRSRATRAAMNPSRQFAPSSSDCVRTPDQTTLKMLVCSVWSVQLEPVHDQTGDFDLALEVREVPDIGQDNISIW